MNDSAPVSPTTRAAAQDDLQTCLQRLDKTLDALEKAERALNAALTEIDARKRLEAVNNELLAVKDKIIAEYQRLVEIAQGSRDRGAWGTIKKILRFAEKVALFAAGIYIGRGL